MPVYNAMLCRTCIDGEVWTNCPDCGGGGCAACYGAGEVKSDAPCPECQGRRLIPFAEAKLRDADRYVRRQDPAWNDDPWAHEGITKYSEAAYFRQRARLYGKVARVAGRKDPTDRIVAVVWLYAAAGEQLASYPGFGWGYGGEGPHGLANLLADLSPERFETFDRALSFVTRLPQDEEWEIRLPPKAEGG